MPRPCVLFWRDFGFAVLRIGIGDAIVGLNVDANRGIFWLGILAKAYEVINLSLRWSYRLTHDIVLLLAAIDGIFSVVFIVFLYTWLRPVSLP